MGERGRTKGPWGGKRSERKCTTRIKGRRNRDL